MTDMLNKPMHGFPEDQRVAVSGDDSIEFHVSQSFLEEVREVMDAFSGMDVVVDHLGGI